jgi:F-type H+-transporting ATPase subunit alpha
MKKVAGKLKLELAQFDDLQAFAQFASDLDQATQNQLARGARLREILKQPQYSPLSVPEQVALVYAGLNGYLDDIPVNKVTGYTAALKDYLKNSKPEYAQTIKDNKMQLTDEAEALLKAALVECKKSFLATA